MRRDFRSCSGVGEGNVKKTQKNYTHSPSCGTSTHFESVRKNNKK